MTAALREGKGSLGREVRCLSGERRGGKRKLGGPWHREIDPAPRKKSGDLPTLDAADFHLIGADGKNGCGRRLTKFASVLRFAAKDGPTDACADSSLCDLRE